MDVYLDARGGAHSLPDAPPMAVDAHARRHAPRARIVYCGSRERITVISMTCRCVVWSRRTSGKRLGHPFTVDETLRGVTPPVCGLINSIRESKDPWKNQLAFPKNTFQPCIPIYICYNLDGLVSANFMNMYWDREW
jgi:hypothetical protein